MYKRILVPVDGSETSNKALTAALQLAREGSGCVRLLHEATAWQADLIVVGTHGRRGLSRVLLGSGAEQVNRTAPVPVLTVRGGPAA